MGPPEFSGKAKGRHGVGDVQFSVQCLDTWRDNITGIVQCGWCKPGVGPEEEVISWACAWAPCHIPSPHLWLQPRLQWLIPEADSVLLSEGAEASFSTTVFPFFAPEPSTCSAQPRCEGHCTPWGNPQPAAGKGGIILERHLPPLLQWLVLGGLLAFSTVLEQVEF